MQRSLVRALLALMLFAGAATLGACNTVHGMGQDIENGADAVKKAF
jgi:predicted small secreted protein